MIWWKCKILLRIFYYASADLKMPLQFLNFNYRQNLLFIWPVNRIVLTEMTVYFSKYFLQFSYFSEEKKENIYIFLMSLALPKKKKTVFICKNSKCLQLTLVANFPYAHAYIQNAIVGGLCDFTQSERSYPVSPLQHGATEFRILYVKFSNVVYPYNEFCVRIIICRIIISGPFECLSLL